MFFPSAFRAIKMLKGDRRLILRYLLVLFPFIVLSFILPFSLFSPVLRVCLICLLSEGAVSDQSVRLVSRIVPSRRVHVSMSACVGFRFGV